MTHWGVWSDIEGGLVVDQCWSEAEASGELAELEQAGETDLRVAAICDDHDDQPADACGECGSDDEDDESA